MVLHRYEARPAAPLGRVLHLGELPCPHARGADVAHLAAAHQVVQRLHGLLDRRGRVEAVDLIQVDRVDPEALQARVGRREYPLARESAQVRPLRRLRTRVIAALEGEVDRMKELRRDHHFVARQQFLQQSSGDLFRDAGRIHVGRVKQVDPELDRPAHDRFGRGLVQHPRAPLGRAVGHHPECNARDLEAARAEVDVLHDARPRSLIRARGYGRCE